MSTLRDRKNSRLFRLGSALIVGLVSLVGLLMALNLTRAPRSVLAEGPTIRYVAPAPLGNDAGSDCTRSSAPCATLQHAVDVADAGDEIRMATGVYSGVEVRPRADITSTGVVTQVAYVGKTLTVRGGYTTTDWSTSVPLSYPTTLDARGQGRVLYVTGDIRLTIEGLDLTEGDATGLGGGIHWGGGDAGGGLYGISATVTLSQSQVFGSFAARGGGLFLLNAADATLIGNVIRENRAGLGGGAVFDQCPGAMLRENTVDHNQATIGGGIEFNDSPDAVLIDNTISHNQAPNSGGMQHHGGVSFTNSDRARLIGNTISGNYAANYCGGACFKRGVDVLLIGNTIAGNETGVLGYTVSEGAGVGISECKNLTMIENEIRDNRTNTSGGGLSVVRSSVSLIANEIVRNRAAQGGGLYVNHDSVVSLRSTSLLSNTAHGYPIKDIPGIGGGLYLALSTATLTNTVIAGNEVELAAGGLYVRDASAELLHTTIARNLGGDGSGAHITGTNSTIALTNTILVSHTVGITVASGSTATLDHTLWGAGDWANLSDWDGEGTLFTSGDIWGAPAFVDPAAGDYHLNHDSAAINAGVDAGVEQDIDGDDRPCPCWPNYEPDLGADEFGVCLFLPLAIQTY